MRIRFVILALVLALLTTFAVSSIGLGQTLPKPIGMIDTSGRLPPWSSFSLLDSNALDQRVVGDRYILYIHQTDDVDLEDEIRRVYGEVAQRGLLPSILAVSYSEELYGLHKYFNADYTMESVDEVYRHWSRAHQLIREVFFKPTITIEAFFNSVPNLIDGTGAALYQPLPDYTDIIGLDPYTPCGLTFFQTSDIMLGYVTRTTTQPIVVIPQWFKDRDPRSQWACGPPDDAFQGWVKWYNHPRVIGFWGFTFKNRPGIVGLEGMPQLLSQINRALGY